MSIHTARINAHSLTESAREWADATMTRIARRQGITKRQARDVLGNRAGISQGTVENLIRERLKSISAADYLALRSAFVSELEHEIRGLEQELARARGAGTDFGHADLVKAQNTIAIAKRLISSVR